MTVDVHQLFCFSNFFLRKCLFKYIPQDILIKKGRRFLLSSTPQKTHDRIEPNLFYCFPYGLQMCTRYVFMPPQLKVCPPLGIQFFQITPPTVLLLGSCHLAEWFYIDGRCAYCQGFDFNQYLPFWGIVELCHFFQVFASYGVHSFSG